MEKHEISQVLPKCDTETQSEQMPLEKWFVDLFEESTHVSLIFLRLTFVIFISYTKEIDIIN